MKHYEKISIAAISIVITFAIISVVAIKYFDNNVEETPQSIISNYADDNDLNIVLISNSPVDSTFVYELYDDSIIALTGDQYWSFKPENDLYEERMVEYQSLRFKDKEVAMYKYKCLIEGNICYIIIDKNLHILDIVE